MALKIICSVAILMMTSTTVFSAVTITAPEEIKILAVNDQEVNTGLFRSKNNSYMVDAGESMLSVRYSQYFEHLNGEHDIVKSGVVTLKTPLLKDGENYRLDLVNAPTNFESAQKYAQQPIIGLFDQNKKILVQQTGVNTASKPWFTHGIFANATDLTQKKSTPINQPAPIYAQSVMTNVVIPTSSTSVGSADQQLIQLWKKSSKVERQQFMAWLAEQSH